VTLVPAKAGSARNASATAVDWNTSDTCISTAVYCPSPRSSTSPAKPAGTNASVSLAAAAPKSATAVTVRPATRPSGKTRVAASPGASPFAFAKSLPTMTASPLSRALPATTRLLMS